MKAQAKFRIKEETSLKISLNDLSLFTFKLRKLRALLSLLEAASSILHKVWLVAFGGAIAQTEHSRWHSLLPFSAEGSEVSFRHCLPWPALFRLRQF